MSRDTMPCYRNACHCDHSRCEAGWINTVDAAGKDWVVSCADCRPDRLPRNGEERTSWLRRIRDEDAGWARKYAA